MNNVYVYTAKNSPGSLVRGTLTAPGLNEALCEIHKNGLVPVDIRLQEGSITHGNSLTTWLGRNVGQADIIAFTRQLANLTQCEVPVSHSLKLIAKRSKKMALREMLEDVIRRVEDGATLSGALTTHKKHFPASYSHMIQSGEMSGQLGSVLQRIADFLEEEERRAAQVKAALYYPLFVLGTGICTIAVMLTFVVPKMSGLFEEFHNTLPLPTKILLSASHLLAGQWLLLTAILGIFFYCFSFWLKTPQGKEEWDRNLLKLPLYGHFIYQAETSRMLRTLGMLLENGVEMIAALSAMRDVAGNSSLKVKLKTVLDDVNGGSNLSQALNRCGMFDETTVGLVHMGEESGDLPKSLNQIAVMYERETSAAATACLSLLGPTLLLVIVGFTGFVVAALLLPIAQMDMLVR
jgi:type II secretory pathway component PulF